MKKLLLLNTLLAGAVAAGAQTTLNYNWCDVFDAGASVMSNVNTVVSDGADGFYTGATFSSSSSLKWNDTDITPAEGLNTTYQKGFTLAKVAADGSLKWNVTTSLGNIANNNLYLANTPDGGVALACNATFGSNAGAGAPSLLTFTDTKGTSTTISYNGAPEGKSPYCVVVLKFNADGAFQWGASATANALYNGEVYDANPVNVRSIAADEEGNIYIGGMHKTATTFSGSSITLPDAANLTLNAAGTGLSDTGDAYIAKYSSEGNLLAVAHNESATPYAGQETTWGLAAANGRLYFLVQANALPDTPYSVFGTPVEISADAAQNLAYGVMNATTLSVEKAESLVSTKVNDKSHVTQVKNFQIINGKTLAIDLALNGGFTQNNNLVAQSKEAKLEGAVITADASTLKATRGFCTAKNIGGDFLSIIDDEHNALYTVGYTLADGTFLHHYNLSTAELVESTTLTSKVSSLSSASYNESTRTLAMGIYAKDLGTIASTDYTAPTFGSFHGYLLAFTLPDIKGTTGIAAASSDISGNAPVEYYNLQGIRLSHVEKGTLVIRRQGSVVTKEIAR